MPEPCSDFPVPIPAADKDLLRECRVEVFRSGGPGGQHQNVTESGVRVIHEPTGVKATAREHRSQHHNKRLALARLREKLLKLNMKPTPRIPTRPSRAAKQRRRENKKRKSAKKQSRQNPSLDDT